MKWGRFAARIATRSPGATPKISRSAFATEATRRTCSAYERRTPSHTRYSAAPYAREAANTSTRERARCLKTGIGSPLAPFAQELHARLVQEPVAVQTPPGELTALGVEGELAVERDARTTLHEGAALALPAEAERLEPGEREEAEAVVELRHVHVRGAELRAPPQHAPRVARRPPREIF